ncbi:hypothetical protein FOZ60_016293 [Perkinsus olseni]|uniref:FAD-binding FR-type domain-containing protein n=1 Tax=Perkinsus olseni TaxID=32597 RepID=A0A7J6P6S5_PEROL|nr:hypothetical protein FOZ60_016293 [Perkinsus olseni]
MATTLPLWSQLVYPICSLIALTSLSVAFVLRNCTVIISALMLATVLQLVTYPPRNLLSIFCVVIGRLAAWAMSISLFLSLRPVANIFKIGFERIAVLHGILGILGLLAGIVHGVLPFYFINSTAKIFARGGLEATIGCGLILLSLLFAIVYRWLPHGYRLFRLTHWLVYVASALIAYHVYLWDERFATFYSSALRSTSGVFIVCLCLSFMERLVELYSAIRQWYHTRRSVTDSVEDSKPLPYCCRIASVKPLTDDTKGLPKACQLTIRCPLKPVPGQWVSLSFPGMDAIGHPYSVLPPLPGAEHEQRFLISGKGFIAQKLLNSPPEALVGEPVLVQGPYGVNDLPRQLCPSGEYAAFICGGSGVAPVASIIQGLPLSVQRSRVSVLWHFYNVDSLDLIYPSIEDVGTKRLLYSGNNGRQVSQLLSTSAEDGSSVADESCKSGPYGLPYVTLLDYHSVPGN